MKSPVAVLLFALCASAEVKTMTLRQALDLALAQSPELMLARLDQQKARDQVVIARDPFVPKIFGGSGVAWTTGFPNSIEGSAPSIFQTKTAMALYDRPQSYQVAQAHEGIRAAEIDVARRRDEVAYRVASLFLQAEQSSRALAAAQREAENLGRVRELVDARVAEGRELPLESRKANLGVLKAKQNVDALALDLIDAETSLALALGLGPDDRVRAAQEERAAIALPDSEEASIEGALENSNELKRIESNMQSKMLEIKGYRAMRLPKINLVAQYSLFAKYNYQDYFARFQRNNAQLGASFEIPLLIGHASAAYVSQSEADVAKLRIEVSRTRTRITADVRRAFQDVRRAEAARDVARADLDLTREQLTIELAQMDEGRLPLAKVEETRAAENEKWLAYYNAQHLAEMARLNVLRQSGTLLAVLR
jgi:outer membrane protein